MAIRISGVKSSRLSEDRKEIIVASSGKYTGELELRFACECVDDLINALTNARAAAQSTAAPPMPPNSTPPPVLDRRPQMGGGAPGGSNGSDAVRFEMPRSFTVTADTSGRGLVLCIFNHKLERQAGYALSPDAAKQIAGGLVKSADALISRHATATKN